MVLLISLCCPAGLRPERDCAGEAKQQQWITNPSSRQRRRHKRINPQLSKENFKEKEKSVTGSDCDLTPGQAGRLTVGCKITLTLRITVSLKWDSKIWSWVLADLDPRAIALAKPRSNCTSKLHTHTIVREGAQHQETTIVRQQRKSGPELQIGAQHQDRLADWPSVETWLQLQDYGLQVMFLSEITQSFYTTYKRIFRLFNIRRDLGFPFRCEKYSSRVLSSLIFMYLRLRQASSAPGHAKLHQQPRHITPPLRNSKKYTPLKREFGGGGERNTARSCRQTNLNTKIKKPRL
jgi:hypothetical protein